MAAARPEVAVGGIAFDTRGRILLVQRAQAPGEGLWTVPGGRVELGETLAAACAREIREETGLEVRVGPVAEVLDRISRDRAGRVAYHFVIVDHLVRVVGGALRAGSDVADARWFSEDELATLPVTEGLLVVLARARSLAGSLA